MFTVRLHLNSGPTPDFIEAEHVGDLASAKEFAESLLKDGIWLKLHGIETFIPGSSMASASVIENA